MVVDTYKLEYLGKGVHLLPTHSNGSRNSPCTLPESSLGPIRTGVRIAAEKDFRTTGLPCSVCRGRVSTSSGPLLPPPPGRDPWKVPCDRGCAVGTLSGQDRRLGNRQALKVRVETFSINPGKTPVPFLLVPE